MCMLPLPPTKNTFVYNTNLLQKLLAWMSEWMNEWMNTLVPWPIPHYLYYFFKCWNFQKFISSKSKNIVKDTSEYLGILHLLKWIFFKLINYLTDMCWIEMAKVVRIFCPPSSLFHCCCRFFLTLSRKAHNITLLMYRISTWIRLVGGVQKNCYGAMKLLDFVVWIFIFIF
jgi:hypothetical protein